LFLLKLSRKRTKNTVFTTGEKPQHLVWSAFRRHNILCFWHFFLTGNFYLNVLVVKNILFLRMMLECFIFYSKQNFSLWKIKMFYSFVNSFFLCFFFFIFYFEFFSFCYCVFFIIVCFLCFF